MRVAPFVLAGLIIGSLATIAILNLTHTPLTPAATTVTTTATKTATTTKTQTAWRTRTTTQTKTETQTTTTTATTTKTLTKTTTQTKTEWATKTKTQTTTAWKTKTTTETQTKTITKTRIETQTRTVTTTEWRTKTVTETVTKVEQVRNFQVLPTPDKAIQLIAHANKTLLVVINIPFRYLYNMKSPTLAKVFNATLEAYRRGADVYVLIIYPTVCSISNKTTLNWYIQQINKLNQTLPPKHVLATKVKQAVYAVFYGNGALYAAGIDYKYIVMTGARLPSAKTQTDYSITLMLYSPKMAGIWEGSTIRCLIKSKIAYTYGMVWPWHACRGSGSPFS